MRWSEMMAAVDNASARCTHWVRTFEVGMALRCATTLGCWVATNLLKPSACLPARDVHNDRAAADVRRHAVDAENFDDGSSE